MYEVIVEFVDLQDNNHKYRVGDSYPRPGVVVTDKRINELKTDLNKKHKPLIIEAKAIEEPLPFSEDAEVKASKPKRGRKKNAD